MTASSGLGNRFCMAQCVFTCTELLTIHTQLVDNSSRTPRGDEGRLGVDRQNRKLEAEFSLHTRTSLKRESSESQISTRPNPLIIPITLIKCEHSEQGTSDLNRTHSVYNSHLAYYNITDQEKSLISTRLPLAPLVIAIISY